MHKDITGQTFGRLTAIRRVENTITSGGLPRTRWECVCSCNNINTKIVRQVALVSGRSASCGCLSYESRHKVKHGKTKTKEWQSWLAAKARCYNPKTHNFHRYGGRGIIMCDEWKYDFTAFYKAMGDCPDGLTLERKDVDGNYCPENCCWATRTTQANNRHTNIFYEFNGERLTLNQIGRKIGINGQVLWARINTQGMAPEIAFSKPKRIFKKTQAKPVE